jgi:6-phosphogluconate dehydrogenase (decarboxylating)
MSDSPIGLIGVGLLGTALAERMLAGGLTVVGYDHLPNQLDRLTQLGGLRAASSREVAARCQQVVLCLPDSQIVAKVVEELKDDLRPSSLLIDATTGDQKWDVKYEGPGWAGVIATSGGVVFSADHQGTFLTIEAKSGKVLYTYPTGGTGYAPPTTYLADGKQYVVIPSGSTMTAFALP